MKLTTLPFRRAALHGAYGAGLTPQAVMAEALRRLEAADDPGIFLDVAPPEVIAAAISALPGFDPVAYPLWGLPVAVKDNIALAGRPMTAACPAFSPNLRANGVPEYPAVMPHPPQTAADFPALSPAHVRA